MTHEAKHAPRRLATCLGPRAGMPAAALIVALALAGCSSGNIGESWQCPLAKGGSCDSVAAADPAVPDPRAVGPTVLGEPLWRVRGNERAILAEGTPCPADCAAGFDPFAWLARLFAAEAHEGETPSAGRTAQAASESAAEDGPEADDLRTGEVVARIWIAPFVDADGVYREASWIRVVLEPAGWRLK